MLPFVIYTAGIVAHQKVNSLFVAQQKLSISGKNTAQELYNASLESNRWLYMCPFFSEAYRLIFVSLPSSYHCVACITVRLSAILTLAERSDTLQDKIVRKSLPHRHREEQTQAHQARSPRESFQLRDLYHT